ncbi:uncharacterized protein YbaP (TraB family) [Pedobacter sp. UYP30]|uniref:TraB/GumN family protein n=1 Tax=Pedobacter sp. UYP30 TaxID=1756400 RepID=UPI0033968065
MKTKIFFLLLTGLSIGYSSKAQKFDNSVCWEIRQSKNSYPSYIFGSIHLLDTTKVRFPIEKIKGLIDKTGMLCLEISGADFKLVSEKLGIKMYLDGDKREKSISNSLDEVHLKKLQLMIDSSNDFFKGFKDMLDYIKPSFLTTMITLEKQLSTSNEFSRSKFNPEGFFTQYCESKSIAVKGLETADEQVDLVVKPSLSFDKAIEELKKSIDDFNKTKTDVDMFFNYSNQNLKLLPKKEYSDSTMISRNTNMANGIDRLLKNNSLFIMIGAAHLPYQHGILNLLAKKGYYIKPYFINLKKEWTN